MSLNISALITTHSLCHQWRTNLKIPGANEIKTVPCTPLSHPCVERLIGTIRLEYLDHVHFWNAGDLERKLEAFRQYNNAHRVQTSLDGNTPSEINDDTIIRHACIKQFSESRIAASDTSYPLPPEYQFVYGLLCQLTVKSF